MSAWVYLPWLPRITTLASIVDAHDPYIVQWQEERDGGRRFWGEKGGKRRRKVKLCCVRYSFLPVLHDSEIVLTTTRCQ